MTKGSSRATERLLDRLPPEQRQRLLFIGSEGRGLFGAARFQSIFEAHLSLFEYLAAAGATAVVIGQLLAEVGIVREDGTPLPPGTVSSALSRARERSARTTAVVPQSAARSGMDMQAPAELCNFPQGNAVLGTVLIESPVTSPPLKNAPMRGNSSLRPKPNGPAGFNLPEHTRRTAALLEQIRSLKDEGT